MNLRTLFVSIVFVAGLLSAAYGQKGPLRTGGLGYAFGGFNASAYSNFDANFRTTGLAQEVNTSGFTVGGGGFALLGTRWVVAGQGYGTFFPMIAAYNVETRIAQGGGGIGVGYALLNKNNLLAFPTVGVGGHGTFLDIDMLPFSSFLPVYGSEVVAAGSDEVFELGIPYLDLGLHLHRLFVPGKGDDPGGFSLGLSLGFQIGLAEGEWQTAEQQVVGGLEPESVNTFYLRLCIGGGGFMGRN